ncbi:MULTISPECIES: hypothetical protein [unclassified Butyrivibrio]|jgi:hypothetical protein|uniref:hypothetical protein n=1 Tax=unclassified Butyrivibrio TaxID=2639466 RepID=UPI0003B6E3C5|nr:MULTISPECIES: hypothetical protein [unclassified Butyrivibrio]MDC7292484.1 glutamyl-tRNA amidotransferase [Butyrivibrio sp. DSM 10294]
MIVVDVFVPALDKVYNFSLNENVKIDAVITEITDMIEQKEKMVFVGDQSKLRLYNKETYQKLPVKNSLSECSIRSGKYLILI